MSFMAVVSKPTERHILETVPPCIGSLTMASSSILAVFCYIRFPLSSLCSPTLKTLSKIWLAEQCWAGSIC